MRKMMPCNVVSGSPLLVFYFTGYVETTSTSSTESLILPQADKEEPSASGADDVLHALEEAIESVNKAVDDTVNSLRIPPKGNSSQNVDAELDQDLKSSRLNALDAMHAFRYPGKDESKAALGNEIFEYAVARILKSKGLSSEDGLDTLTFSDADIELLANASGCQPHLSRRHVDCSANLCHHLKYRSIDGSCNNFQNPLAGAALTTFRRLLPSKYENGFFTPLGEQRLFSISKS